MNKALVTLLAVTGLIRMSSLPVHARHGGHGHFSGSIWVGPVGAPWWGPAYPFYGYPYYVSPPVVVPRPTDEYVQQQEPQSEEDAYWYYCQDPNGYYPYVKKCPNGWLKVAPSPAPPDEGE